MRDIEDIEDIEDIKFFVNAFYEKIRSDEMLSPIFALKIEKDNWQPHLEKMYQFWNTILFHKREYKGNPGVAHFGLPVGKEHFDRWLELFYTTIDASFEGERAEETKRRVEIMAAVFLAKIQFNQQRPNYKPIV